MASWFRPGPPLTNLRNRFACSCCFRKPCSPPVLSPSPVSGYPGHQIRSLISFSHHSTTPPPGHLATVCCRGPRYPVRCPSSVAFQSVGLQSSALPRDEPQPIRNKCVLVMQFQKNCYRTHTLPAAHVPPLDRHLSLGLIPTGSESRGVQSKPSHSMCNLVRRRIPRAPIQCASDTWGSYMPLPNLSVFNQGGPYTWRYIASTRNQSFPIQSVPNPAGPNPSNGHTPGPRPKRFNLNGPIGETQAEQTISVFYGVVVCR